MRSFRFILSTNCRNRHITQHFSGMGFTSHNNAADKRSRATSPFCYSTVNTTRITNRLGTPASAMKFSTSFEERCWNCRETLTESTKFFCDHCGTILTPANSNYFDILGVEKSFQVSPNALQRSLKESQRLLHPDKFTLKSAREQELSEQASSLINVAYFTLVDPLRRAIYILKLEGVIIDEDTQMNDPEFLMEIMELNEEIAAADGSEPLKRLQSRIRDECSKLVADVSIAFESKRLEEAKDFAIKLRYFNNMSQKLRHLIPPT